MQAGSGGRTIALQQEHKTKTVFDSQPVGQPVSTLFRVWRVGVVGVVACGW
jgi:hypothetical protein